MNSLYWGIVVFIICCVVYLGAFRLRDNKPAIALMLLVIAGLLLRMFTAADCYLHEWDERYHALVAKNLLEHLLHPTLYEHTLLPADYTNWTVSHTWVHKQPIPLWLIAFCLKICGIHTWVVRLPAIILSTIGIKLVYDVARHLISRQTAFITAFLFSIHGLIIELAAGRHPTDAIDVCFMFFVLLSVWFAVKSADTLIPAFAILTGVTIGCAILCKWLPALIVVPVWLLLLYGKVSIKTLLLQLCMLVSFIALVALPWQWYILSHYPIEAKHEYAQNARHITDVLDFQDGNFFFYFNGLRIVFGELIYIPVICFTYKCIRYPDPKRLAILIWFWLPYLFFSFCATKMTAYIIFAAPAIFMMTADTLLDFKDNLTFKPRLLRLAIAWALILLPVRYTIERVKPFTSVDHNPEWNQAIENFVPNPLNTPKTVLFNCPHYVEMMFLTSCTCYEHPPADSTAARLTNEGYQVVIQQGNTFIPYKPH